MNEEQQNLNRVVTHLLTTELLDKIDLIEECDEKWRKKFKTKALQFRQELEKIVEHTDKNTHTTYYEDANQAMRRLQKKLSNFISLKLFTK